jgi:UDP-2,3-diacylglucosamine pyrophosphatase LpxH
MLAEARTVFLSDSHLGIRLARARELLGLLRRIRPERLYLVGDIFDAWVLSSRWYWPQEYTAVVERILELAASGTQVQIVPGNHDAFLRGRLPQYPGISIADEYLYETVDGRRFIVAHGDLFDGIEKGFRWLSKTGSFFYTLVIDCNIAANWVLRKLGMRPRYFAFWIKRTSKRILGANGRFRRKLVQHAVERDVDGIICGHVHLPQILHEDGVAYVNIGDWLDNASALLELPDGDLVLVNHGTEIARLAPEAGTGAHGENQVNFRAQTAAAQP